MQLETNIFRLFGVIIGEFNNINHKNDDSSTCSGVSSTSDDHSTSVPTMTTTTHNSSLCPKKRCLDQTQSHTNNNSKKSKTTYVNNSDMNTKSADNKDTSDHSGSPRASKSSERVLRVKPLSWCFPISPNFGKFYEYITTNLGGDGDSVKLIIHKKLKPTDLMKHNPKLTLPKTHIERFLTEEEEEWLSKKEEGGKKKMNKMEVIVLDPSLGIWDGERSLRISRLNYPKKANESPSWCYVLQTNWTKLMTHNQLQLGHVIQVWCFRVHAKLGLALIRI